MPKPAGRTFTDALRKSRPLHGQPANAISAMIDASPCVDCGHPLNKHPSFPDAGPCPATPPAKSDFAASLKAAQDAESGAAKLKLAEEHFERRPGEPVPLDIRIQRLQPMKGNPRGDDLGDTSGLEKVMEVAGFLGTLVVRRLNHETEIRDDSFEVVVGNRRLKAAKAIGLTVLPCDVYELTDVQALELNMAEQTNRVDYTPLMEGDACRRLVELAGYTAEQVGEKFGKSASWVTKRIQLDGIAPELRKAVTKGGLSVTLAQALAAIPTPGQQVKTYDALEARPEHEKRNATAESDAQWIRNTVCLPLAGATWKVTDAELTEAGACSVCPKNSANDKAPGLFDSVKSKPMCLDRACFEDKALAAWLLKTAKQKAAGAKVLSLNESKKLFARGNDLGSASRYVEAGDQPPKDKAGRTWAELVADVPGEHRPQLHLAQDNGGKLRQLYVSDKALEAVAVHLKARWAKTVVEEAVERTQKLSTEAQAKADAESDEARQHDEVRAQVTQMVLDRIAAKVAQPGAFPVLSARFLASRHGARAVERFAEACGRKKFPKDWLEKGATLEECFALMWLADVSNHLSPPPGSYDEETLRLAKQHGFDVKAMHEAQLATAKSEAAK